jgi:hypothetical protein
MDANHRPNALKWTEEAVTNRLLLIETEAITGSSLFLGRALVKYDLYKQIWIYWKQAFCDNETIIDLMLRIEGLFEARLLEGALKKELSQWMVVLALKNNHGWQDKPDKPATGYLPNDENRPAPPNEKYKQ